MVLNRAQFLGGACGAIAAVGWLVWSHLLPHACKGAVFIEFRPPLLQPGPYHFSLGLDAQPAHCSFDVPLPTDKPVNTAKCGMPLELQTRGTGADASIIGLTVGASPKKIRVTINQGKEVIYDSRLEPVYAAEDTPRTESKRFCGPRARLTPDCIRGTSACAPYATLCDGPEDCSDGKICCVSPESALEYGIRSASHCKSTAYCIGRLAHIACHVDSDCPKGMTCSDTTLAADFKPALRACR